MKKRIVVAVCVVVILLIPGVSKAQYAIPDSSTVQSSPSQAVVDLRAQIQSLLAVIAQLQAQMSKLANGTALPSSPPTTVPTVVGLPSTGTSASSSCVIFYSDLHPGDKGIDVARLQQFLRTEGDFTYPKNTGYFGPSTKQAVQKWQAAHTIVSSGTPKTTGYGAIGPQTRQAIQKQTCATAGQDYNQVYGQDYVIPTPTIKNFTVDSIASIPSDLQTSVLTWNVINATSCVLQNDRDEETVPVVGSKTIHPTQTTTYELSCINDLGVTKDGPSVKTILTVVPESKIVDPASKTTTSASLDQNSSIVTSSTPTLTGYAYNTNGKIVIVISLNNKEVWKSGGINVTNNRWSTIITSRWSLEPATHHVDIYSNNVLIGSGSFMVTESPVIREPIIHSVYVGKEEGTADIFGEDLTSAGVYFNGKLVDTSKYTHSEFGKISFYLPNSNPGTYSIYIINPVGKSNTINLVIQPTTPRFISLLSPKGGEVYHPGDTIRVKWSSKGADKVKVTFYTVDADNLEKDNTIKIVPASTGYYDFPIDQEIKSEYNSNNFYVKVADADYAAIYDKSDSYFTLGSSQSSISSITIDSSTSGTVIPSKMKLHILWSGSWTGFNVGIGLCPVMKTDNLNGCTNAVSYPNTGIADVDLLKYDLARTDGQYYPYIMDPGTSNPLVFVVGHSFGIQNETTQQNVATLDMATYRYGFEAAYVQGKNLTGATIYFNGNKIDSSNYTFANDSLIDFRMPLKNPGVYPVYAITEMGKSNTVNLVSVAPPVQTVDTVSTAKKGLSITSVTYDKEKNTVRVFGKKLSAPIVYFDGKSIERNKYTYITDSEVRFLVPVLKQRSYPVYITNTSGRSNTINMAISGSATHQPLITLTSPKGGEVYNSGEPVRVSWVSEGVDKVKVTVYKSDGSNSSFSSPVISSSLGHFNFVPSGAEQDLSGLYYARVDAMDNETDVSSNITVRDVSDLPFSIGFASTSKPSVGVTLSPSGTMTTDSVVRLVWKTTGTIKKIGIGFCPVGQAINTRGCTNTVYINNTNSVNFSLRGFFSKSEQGQYYSYFKDMKSNDIYGLGNVFTLSNGSVSMESNNSVHGFPSR